MKACCMFLLFELCTTFLMYKTIDRFPWNVNLSCFRMYALRMLNDMLSAINRKKNKNKIKLHYINVHIISTLIQSDENKFLP